MPDFIDRYAAKSLLPPEISREIIQGAIKYSVGMQIFKRGRNMTTGELIMPALSMLPVGGWLKATPIHKDGFRLCGASAGAFFVIQHKNLSKYGSIPSSFLHNLTKNSPRT